MSTRIEWVEARRARPSVAWGPEDLSDGFGNIVSEGMLGIAFESVCVEGTPEELRAFFMRCVDLLPKEES